MVPWRAFRARAPAHRCGTPVDVAELAGRAAVYQPTLGQPSKKVTDGGTFALLAVATTESASLARAENAPPSMARSAVGVPVGAATRDDDAPLVAADTTRAGFPWKRTTGNSKSQRKTHPACRSPVRPQTQASCKKLGGNAAAPSTRGWRRLSPPTHALPTPSPRRPSNPPPFLPTQTRHKAAIPSRRGGRQPPHSPQQNAPTQHACVPPTRLAMRSAPNCAYTNSQYAGQQQ